MRTTYLHQYFNTPSMPGGTCSNEMARRLVAMGHEVKMVKSWREPDGRKDWFIIDEAIFFGVSEGAPGFHWERYVKQI